MQLKSVKKVRMIKTKVKTKDENIGTNAGENLARSDKHLLILLIILLFGCSDNIKKQNLNSIETISIDMRKDRMELFADISSLIDTSYFEIIPLETKHECLIAKIKNIYLINDKIVVYDEKANGAYIFNRDGSYRAKIHAVGQGPGEYPNWVNDMNASENYISVLTRPGIMLYDYDGKYVKTIPRDNRWGQNVFTFDEINYYVVNCWSFSSNGGPEGCYHLFKYDTEQNVLQSWLPFSINDAVNNRGWTLDKFYNIYDNKALIYISSVDTIYCLTSDSEVYPRYAIDISHRKLPDNLRTGDGTTALLAAQKNDYEMGVFNVVETSRYLFLKLLGGIAIYDKKEKEIIATARLTFKIASFWDEIVFTINYSLNDKNEVITHLDGSSFYSIKTFITEQKEHKLWKLGKGTNPFQKELFKIAQNFKDEEENPVLIIIKMKDEGERY